MVNEVKSQTFGNTCSTLLRTKWHFQWLPIYQLEDMEDMQVAVSRLGLPEQDKRLSCRCAGKRQLYGALVATVHLTK